MPECDVCGDEFDSARGVAAHRRQMHPDADDPAADDADTADRAETGGDTVRTADSIRLDMRVPHALALMFVVGTLVGGFFVSTAYGMTGMAPAAPTGDTVDSPDNADDGAGNNQNSRVDLTAEMLQDEPTLGSSDAELTIVEYSDFGCPWCAEWAGVDAIPQRPIDQESSLEKIKSNYIDNGKVRFVFKDYPVSQLHPNAPQAHVAANCILEQGDDLYWEFHDALFERRSEWTRSGQGNTGPTFVDIANTIGADADAMQSCAASSDGSEISDDRSKIQSVDGSLGTPTFYIGTVEDGFLKVQGAQPYSNLKRIIDSELNK